MKNLLKNYALRQQILKDLDSLKRNFQKVKDNRSVPTYSLPEVLTEIIKGLVTGAKSFQDIEQLMQDSNFFTITCTDSCLGKIISQIPDTEAKHFLEILQQQYNTYSKKELTLVRLSDDREINVRHFDGTRFLNHRFSFVVSGGAVNLILGIKWHSNMGEEFSATKQLLEEIRQLDSQSGMKPFQTLNTFDGRYYSSDLMKEIHGNQEGFFIRIRKDDQRNLEPIEFLETFLQSESDYMKSAIKQVTGEDPKRGIRFTVSYTRVELEKIGFWVTVARIHKEFLKPRRKRKTDEEEQNEREIYVITNLWNLSAKDIYELSTSHWEIETTFKNLKEQFVSSRTRMKYPVAALIWATLIAIAYNIVTFFSHKLHLKTTEKTKKTLKHIREILQRMISSMRRTLNKILYSKDEQKENSALLCSLCTES